MVCFLGADPALAEAAGAYPATTLAQAAALAAGLAAAGPTGTTGGDVLAALEAACKRAAAAGRARTGRARTESTRAARPVRRRHLLLRSATCVEGPARAGLQQCSTEQGQQDIRSCGEPWARLHRPGRGRVHPGASASDDRSQPAQPAHPPGGARPGHGRDPARRGPWLRRASRTRPGQRPKRCARRRRSPEPWAGAWSSSPRSAAPKPTRSR